MTFILIFTDGACMGNGTPSARAGWAYGVFDERTLEMTYSQKGRVADKQTNNRAELNAIYEALKYVYNNRHIIPKNETILIYSDSEIMVKGINGECSRNANRDLWDAVEPLCDSISSEMNNKIIIQYIEAHKCPTDNYDLHKLNCDVDKLAKSASRALLIA